MGLLPWAYLWRECGGALAAIPPGNSIALCDGSRASQCVEPTASAAAAHHGLVVVKAVALRLLDPPPLRRPPVLLVEVL